MLGRYSDPDANLPLQIMSYLLVGRRFNVGTQYRRWQRMRLHVINLYFRGRYLIMILLPRT
jgi:hypothetical protein